MNKINLDGPALALVEIKICSAATLVVCWSAGILDTVDQPSRAWHPESQKWCDHPGELMPLVGTAAISKRHTDRMFLTYGAYGPVVRCGHGIMAARARAGWWAHAHADRAQHGEICHQPPDLP